MKGPINFKLNSELCSKTSVLQCENYCVVVVSYVRIFSPVGYIFLDNTFVLSCGHYSYIQLNILPNMELFSGILIHTEF